MIAKPGWALISPASLFALLPVLTSRLLQQAGLNPERLILETGSRNPAENFRQLQSLLPDADGRYLLVISAFHMPRAVGVAEKQRIGLAYGSIL